MRRLPLRCQSQNLNRNLSRNQTQSRFKPKRLRRLPKKNQCRRHRPDQRQSGKTPCSCGLLSAGKNENKHGHDGRDQKNRGKREGADQNLHLLGLTFPDPLDQFR